MRRFRADDHSKRMTISTRRKIAFARLVRNIAQNPALARRIHAEQVMLVADVAAPLEPAVYASWPLAPTASAHPLHLGVALSTHGARKLTLDHAIAEAGAERVAL